MIKRDCSLFLCPSLPSLSSPAPLRHTDLGFLMGGGCAGNDNHNAKGRLSAHISQDHQRPPKWFRVTWCGSIVYLIKKWPIQPHTIYLVLFVAWLPAKAFLNRPCVSHCGDRHLSIDSVSSWGFFRFGWFWFSYFSFLVLIFPFSNHLSLLLGVNFVEILPWLIKTPVQASIRNIKLEIWLLVRAFPYFPKSKPALEITSDSQSFLLSLVQIDCSFKYWKK